MTGPTDLNLDRRRAALLIIDIQERLAAAMPDEALARAERNVTILLEAARRLELPVVKTQQYPKGLGQTTQAVTEACADLGPLLHELDKVEFSACDAADFEPVWNELGRDQWIVTGMETHVCVYQTARQLVARGAAVHVPQDAVSSRHHDNWRVGLDLISRAGGIVTSTEVVVFDLLERAGTDDFKALSRLVR
jgi:nicotinamidase-related amidase